MTRFNKTLMQPAPINGAVVSQQASTITTALGGAGYARAARGELFLLATTNLVGQDLHHEWAKDRDGRYAQLITQVAAEDSGVEFLCGFLHWLRTKANMRTAPLVGAAHLVAARRGMDDPQGLVRSAVAGSLGRPDEPGEILAFWTATYGGTPPRALKAGVARAVIRLYTERSMLKWDTASKAWRFGRVLDVTHPTLQQIEQESLTRRAGNGESAVPDASFVHEKSVLFGFLGSRMRGRDEVVPEELRVVRARRELYGIPPADRRTFLSLAASPSSIMAKAGMDWQAAAEWYSGPLDALFWSALIPTMGVQALLMNLRNFDKADLAGRDVDLVCSILEDAEKVQQSRILPMQVLSAHRAVADTNGGWGRSLGRALDASLANVPVFDGKTLIMVDTSSSMNDPLSARGELRRWDAAVIFAAALAKRAEQAEIVSFSSSAMYWGDPVGPKTRNFTLGKGESLLKAIDRWKRDGYFLGGGTDTSGALRKHYRPEHTRVIVITDEQAGVDPIEVDRSVPANTPMITLNLAGYRAGHAPSGTKNRVVIGGLNDAAFAVLAGADKMTRGVWPWQRKTTEV